MFLRMGWGTPKITKIKGFNEGTILKIQDFASKTLYFQDFAVKILKIQDFAGKMLKIQDFATHGC